jgi:hypothetical protein
MNVAEAFGVEGRLKIDNEQAYCISKSSGPREVDGAATHPTVVLQ